MNKKDPSFARSWATLRPYPDTWADPGKLDQAFWEFYLFVFVFSSAHHLESVNCETPSRATIFNYSDLRLQ
jgi:hypothetical protein